MSEITTRTAKEEHKQRQILLQNTQTLWTHRLQRRTMRLLEHLDPELFHGQFRTFYIQSARPKIPVLQFYDRYLRLHLLSDELFEDILLRLQHQISLQTSHVTQLEDAPTRGEIDWLRTLERNFDEAPDEMPHVFNTMRRESSMATPENLFVIVVLQEYHQALQEVLDEDQKVALLTKPERQHIATVAERLERFLAIPDIRMLRSSAHGADPEQLAEQVAARLRPSNRPYHDLLTWWEQFRTLHIGNMAGKRQLSFTTKRQDIETAQWLYQLWIALEMLELMQKQQLLISESLLVLADTIQFHFQWQERRFIFSYRQQSELDEMSLSVQPMYTIIPEEPFRLAHNGWQEPPLALSARYCVSEQIDQCNALRQSALEQFLGELQLLGARHGCLITAHPLKTEQSVNQPHEIELSTTIAGMNTSIAGSIKEYQLSPALPTDQVQETLRIILQQVIECLPLRQTPTCHGILLDLESINAGRDRLVNGNVLCPKPHLGQGVIDIVSLSQHCLRDASICPIYGQRITPPFVLRADTLDEIEQQGTKVRTQSDQMLQRAEEADNEAQAEHIRSTVFLGVGRSVERYVKMYGNTATIEASYEEWIFGIYWNKHARCLSVESRNILLSAAYVWDEYKQTTTLTDWAAPAIQFCRALENELKRRIHDYYPEAKTGGFKFPQDRMTLGTIPPILDYKDRDETLANGDERKRILSASYNWDLCKNIVTLSNGNHDALYEQLKRFKTENIVTNRNALAHGGAVSQQVAQELRDSILGSKDQQGILLWLAENIEPKTEDYQQENSSFVHAVE